jgi:MFS family permease
MLRSCGCEGKADMTASASARSHKIFYGYWILVAAFYFAFIFSGCGFYAFSLFVVPLEAEFGWNRGGIMLALSLSFLAGGLTAPLVGRLVDRYGARKVIIAGALVGVTGFILSSRVKELWQFYGTFIIIGIAMAGIGSIPTTAVVSNWFKKRRGMAIGIMSAGIGAGGLVLSPLLGGYIIPHFGWRIAFLVLALFVAAIIPLALLIIKAMPSEMGLYPDGASAPAEATETKTTNSFPKSLTLRTAISTSTFWLIAVSFLTFGIAEVGVLQNEVPYLQGVGFSAAMAAGIHGMVGLWSTIGKFIFGWLCDKINAKYACAIGTALQIVGTLLLMNIERESATGMVWLYAFLIGLGLGNWLPTMSILVSTNFGLLAYGAIFGMIAFSQSLGASIAPFFTGQMYNALGTYYPVFVVLAISYLISMVSVLFVRRPKVSSSPIG